MGLPTDWNSSRAIALAATLALHAVLVAWLLSLRIELPDGVVERPGLVWLPLPETPDPLPPPVEAIPTDMPPPAIAPITAPPMPVLAPPAPADWSGSAREVAKDMTAGPAYRAFGETPKAPPGPPKERHPPSIFEKPLPRVGKTVVTPDAETIIWVSDYCYVSISSRSLTQKEIHDARKGVRTCIYAQFGDRKKARDDLFDPIKRPPPPQEPGCGKDGIGQSCAR